MSPQPGGQLMRDVSLAFIRIHVLHHAALEPVFGVEMMEELRRHGYAISPGTLYPLLHSLEAGGVLASTQEVAEGRARRYYRTTRAGDAVLRELRDRIRELVDEVMDAEAPAGKPRRRT